MASLLNDVVESALCVQMADELYNAQVYLRIAGLLGSQGLNQLSKKFEKQREEEIGHQKDIFDYIVGCGGDPCILEIPSPSTIPISSISDIAKTYLERELETTDSLGDILSLAIEQADKATEQFIREMIAKQIDEHKEAVDFSDKAALTGNDWFKVFVWDLGERGV